MSSPRGVGHQRGVDSEPGVGLARQTEIYLAGVRGHRPAVPFDHRRLERQARSRLTAEAFAYIAGGAGAERTMAANRAAFDRWRIVPRVLRDVSDRDLSVELLGRRLPTPFLLAPIGVLELAHDDADVAVAKAAAAEGVPMIFSNQASRPMEECAAVMRDCPRWFQLYWSTSDDLVASFVARAEACGCEAIVVTLDTKMLGWRSRDLDFAHLPFATGRGIAQYTSDPVFRSLVDPSTAQRSGPPTPAAVRALVRATRSYPGSFRAEPALRRRCRGRAQGDGDLLAPVAHVGRLRLAARADDAADRGQGDPPPRRRAPGRRARPGRDRRLQPRRPPGRRRDRLARGAAGSRRGDRRPDPGPVRQRRSAAAQTPSRRLRSARPRCCSGDRTSTASRCAARRACAT